MKEAVKWLVISLWIVGTLLIAIDLHQLTNEGATLTKQMNELHRALSDYNYLAGSRGLPQIGMGIDGKPLEGSHGLMNDEYLKERNK